MTAPTSKTLIGRDEEVRRITTALDDGRWRGIAFVGQAGVGKSRLADEARQLGEAAGMTAVTAFGTAVSASITLGALSHILPPAGEIADVHVELQPTQLLQAARSTLERLGEGTKLMLIVDDAHHLDPVSAHLVHQLAVTAAAFVVVTIRTGEQIPDSITALWKEGLVDRIDTTALDADETSELASALLGAQVDAHVARWLWRTSNGNALFARELVIGGREAGSLQLRHGIWQLVAGASMVSPRLAELVESRLVHLDAAARRALDLVALAEPIGLDVAEEIVGSDVLSELDEAGLLRVTASGHRVELQTVHPLYGEALRQQPLTLRRRADLRALVETIERLGARRRDDPVRIAGWQLAAGGRPDPATLYRAALAAQYGFDDNNAARLARLALDQQPADPVLRSDIALCLATALARLGQFQQSDAALAPYEPMERDPDRRMRMVLLLASCRFEGNDDVPGALELLTRAEATLPSGPWQATLQYLRVTTLADAGRAGDAAAVLEAGEQAPLSPSKLVPFNLAKVATLTAAGRFEEGVAAAGSAYDYHLAHPDADSTFHPISLLMYRAMCEVRGGWMVEARRHGTEILSSVIDQPRPIAAVAARLCLARCLLSTGDIAEAKRLSEQAAVLCTPNLQPYLLRATAVMQALCDLETGDPVSAYDRIESLQDAPMLGVLLFGCDLPISIALAQAGTGRRDAGLAGLITAGDTCAARGDFGGAAEIYATAALRLGNVEAARRLLDVLDRVNAPIADAYRSLGVGLLDRSLVSTESAAASFRRLGLLPTAARLSAQAADLARDAGDQRTATRLRQQASDDVRRCNGLRAALAVSADTVVALTPREHEIAALVCSGKPSKDVAEILFLSARTVDNHLQRIYAKLGVTNRRELAEALGLGGSGR